MKYMFRDPSGRPNQYVTAIQAVGEIIQVSMILMTLFMQIKGLTISQYPGIRLLLKTTTYRI
jgi:hypothetical protein